MENVIRAAEAVFVGVAGKAFAAVVAVDPAADVAVEAAAAGGRRAAATKWPIIAAGRKAIRWNTVDLAATPRQTS